jgi:hypothetical protein
MTDVEIPETILIRVPPPVGLRGFQKSTLVIVAYPDDSAFK